MNNKIDMKLELADRWLVNERNRCSEARTLLESDILKKYSKIKECSEAPITVINEVIANAVMTGESEATVKLNTKPVIMCALLATDQRNGFKLTLLEQSGNNYTFLITLPQKGNRR